MINCNQATAPNRRSFWTTQLDACGTDATCTEQECGRPGLAFDAALCERCRCCPDGNMSPRCAEEIKARTPRSFVTKDWLRSLILNILMTDGKLPDTPCGYRPGTQGGHWSESFRTDGQKIGSLVRDLKTITNIQNSVNLVKAKIIADLGKLVNMGLVVSIDVEAKYIGNLSMSLDIEVFGQNGDNTRVGLSGKRLNNSFVWN